MSKTLVARRFAGALLELARTRRIEETVGTELARFAALLNASPELRAVFENPAIQHPERRKVLDALVGDGDRGLNVSSTTADFLRLCIDKGRAGIIEEASSAYKLLLDEALGRVRATVRSTRPLGTDDRAALTAQLEAVTGKRVLLTAEIDPSLLGGVVTSVGSLVFDGSVKGRLETLRDRLVREAGY